MTGGTEATTTLPQPTFPHRAYGVNVTWFGEDGEMAAYGHIPDLRFIAACNHLARTDAKLRNIWDDPCALLEDALLTVNRIWVVPAPLSGRDFEWEVTWHGITEQTPGAIPLTVLWP